MMTIDQIIDAVERVGTIPTPSDVVVSLLDTSTREDHSGAQIAVIVSRDPILAGKILRVANSAALGVTHEITSLQRAVAILGTHAVVTSALTLSVIGRPLTFDCPDFDDPQFRLQSLACGVAARELSRRVGDVSEAEAFTAGSLSQLGRAVLAIVFPKEYSIVSTGAPSIPRDLLLLEQHSCGTTYPKVGAALLRRWGVPERLCAAVETFREQRNADGPTLARILDAAEAIATTLCPCRGLVPPTPSEVASVATSLLRFDHQEVEAAIGIIEAQVRELRSLYHVEQARMIAPHELDRQVRQRVAELSLGAGLKRQQSDPDVESVPCQATTDPPTGLANQAALRARLALEIERAKGDLALVLIGIDDFDLLKRWSGEDVAGEVLRRTADVLRRSVRAGDHLARVSEERFALLAPRACAENVAKLARRLQERIRQAFANSRTPPVTISAGIAVCSKSAPLPAPHELVRVATERLAAARDVGRNNIAVAIDGRACPVPLTARQNAAQLSRNR